MDFGSVLYKAQKNEQNSKQSNNFYKTSFDPPKKQQREKKLSINIQKFLARKEEEERKRKLEAERKKQELLALRNQDKKSFKRVQSMLKRTKSANKSVLEDAIDNVNTAVTAVGPLQPDEDDYGYVSKDATELYNKLINKYSNMPPEEPKYSKSSVKSSKDILNTKDRVKAALQREEDEKLLPRKRKRKSKHGEDEGNEQNSDNEGDEPTIEEKPSDKKNEERFQKPEKFKIPKKTAQLAPPMDFQALLKLAEKKQYEPIKIEKKVDDKPDRPMTEKEKQEFLREQARKLKKEMPVATNAVNKKQEVKSKSEMKDRKEDRSKSIVNSSSSTSISESQGKKVAQKITERAERDGTSSSYRPLHDPANSNDSKKFKNSDPSRESKQANSVTNKPKNVYFERSETIDIKTETPSITKKPKPPNMSGSHKPSHNSSLSYKEQKPKLFGSGVKTNFDSLGNSSKLSSESAKMSKLPQNSYDSKSVKCKKPTPSQTIKKFPPSDLLPPRKISESKKHLSVSKSESARQFPPPDIFRKKPKPMPIRRKVIESDDEYDSEMDDFIDDSEDVTDVSRHISEIFGYDRSRYSRIDEEDDEECMESNFSQLQKEEFFSTKYGILEDLADVRRTKMEKERKKQRMMAKR